jgi:hypothetical protein
LEVTDCEAEGGCSTEGPEVDGLDAAWEAHIVYYFAGCWVEVEEVVVLSANSAY